MTGKLELALDIEGYDVSVVVHAESIERQIESAEEDERVDLNRHGFRDVDLNKYAQVHVEPTEDKWEELGDKLFDKV